MNGTKIKTIALVEWNWVGHHPMYFKLFVRVLLDLDCSVLALCPNPYEVADSLQDLTATTLRRLTLRNLEWPSTPRGCPPGLRHLSVTLKALYQVRKQAREWEASHHLRLDLIFFACIYDAPFRLFRHAEWILPYRWSGLYLHSRVFRLAGLANQQDRRLPGPRFLRSPKLHSIAILDEGALTAARRLSTRAVVLFPDLTDESVSSEPSSLATKMRAFASGAPIVAVLGHLQPSKGVTTLAHLALDPSYRNLCFAFIGEVSWNLFSPADRVLISSLMDRCPNVFTHFERIADERSFNSAIQACDVIFAAYLDFPNSSGLLTKAAIFRKPIIVSEGFLMAERVRKHQIGEVVREGDVEATGRAIREITKDGGNWVARNSPRWDEYHRQHCYASLLVSFSDILGAS